MFKTSPTKYWESGKRAWLVRLNPLKDTKQLPQLRPCLIDIEIKVNFCLTIFPVLVDFICDFANSKCGMVQRTDDDFDWSMGWGECFIVSYYRLEWSNARLVFVSMWFDTSFYSKIVMWYKKNTEYSIVKNKAKRHHGDPGSLIDHSVCSWNHA